MKLQPWKAALVTLARILTFRATRQELQQLDARNLTVGLLCVWLAGIGRWWDDPAAGTIQKLGIGSLIYVFVLAWFLWFIIASLRPKHWSYRGILIFVTQTSPSAFLYAMPVELWLGKEAAIMLNLWLLALVASWRVSLWVFYLLRGAELDRFATTIGTLLPLSIIVSVLGFLRVAGAVMSAMGGLRSDASDTADQIVAVLTLIAIVAVGPLLGIHAWLGKQHRNRQ